MIIPDDPFKGLLDDENATKTASEQLKPWTNLLRDLANYGSNLIPRAYTSSEKTLGDAVVIGVLLKQVVAMIDAIEILLSRSAVHAAGLQVRAMFEASLYLEWMLAGDREEKAAHYYVFNLLRQRVWAMRVQSGTPESRDFKEIMSGLPVNDSLGDEGKKQVVEIDRVLAQARFAEIADELRTWKKRNGRKPSWYSPIGVNDLRDLARKVKKEPEYVMTYTSGSETTHASNYGQHITFDGDRRITFLSIRHPKGFPNTVRLTATIALATFRKILDEYRAGERTRFDQKYVEKWRQVFMNMPVLKIDATEIGI